MSGKKVLAHFSMSLEVSRVEEQILNVTQSAEANLCVLCRPLAKKSNVVFALTLHGGHLGFFEGAVLFPQPLTWMDKVIVGYANAMCQWEKQKPPCQSTDLSQGPCTGEKA